MRWAILLFLPLVLAYTLQVPLGRDCIENVLPPPGLGTARVVVEGGSLTITSSVGTFFVEKEAIVPVSRQEEVTIKLCGQGARAEIDFNESPILEITAWVDPLIAGSDSNLHILLENTGSAPARALLFLPPSFIAEKEPPEGIDVPERAKIVRNVKIVVGDVNGELALPLPCIHYSTPWGERVACGDLLPVKVSTRSLKKCVCLGSDCLAFREDRLFEEGQSKELLPNTPLSLKYDECAGMANEIIKIYLQTKDIREKYPSNIPISSGLILLSLLGFGSIGGRVKKEKR